MKFIVAMEVSMVVQDDVSKSGRIGGFDAGFGDEMLMELGLPRSMTPVPDHDTLGKPRMRRLARVVKLDPDVAAARFCAATAKNRESFHRGLQKYLAQRRVAAPSDVNDASPLLDMEVCRDAGCVAGQAALAQSESLAIDAVGSSIQSTDSMSVHSPQASSEACTNLYLKIASGSARVAAKALRVATRSLSANVASSIGVLPLDWAQLVPKPPTAPVPPSRFA
eukprot:CAMPEP_0115441832 /NCGR_PEP_ID=MMETSP0271-20121206/37035_1 /TAXON_ID=71861 /ORGANISM="Scrippsiella trochoidea, Strain CCMP3099" /LENGTH=222 /DNA_ID=CAMNT_0002867647 /DNA_START=199 /DNA_END=863 /DNA_ORIENTATION=-